MPVEQVEMNTILSYFNKRPLHRKWKWLGIAAFVAWTYDWPTAAISYYLRTLPNNPQHPPPSFLLPYEWPWLQLALPFLLGGIIAAWILRGAIQLEQSKAARR